MKYNININQYAVIKNGLDLDAIDMIIFDFIKDFANSKGCVKMQTAEGVYFWVSHKAIIDGLPLLKITTTRGVGKRVDNLISADVLSKHPNCEAYGKTLYCFGKNYDALMFYGDERKATPLNESSTPPRNKRSTPPEQTFHRL